MPQLQIHLFGAPLIKVDHVPVETGRRKAIALLAYLAVTNRPHTRDALATLLWSDYTEVNARAALRGVLNSLKAALGDTWLQSEREMIALRQDEYSWVDVSEFRRFLAESQSHGPEDEPTWPQLSEQLASAEALFRDDFLAGFTLRGSAAFDEWQSFQTEKLRQELASVLERLVNGWRAAKDYPKAISYAQRWLNMDLLQESAHRALMELYALSNLRGSALRQYEACQAALSELGVNPEAATTALYQAISAGQFPPLENRTVPSPEGIHFPPELTLPKHNLPVKLTPFLAREAELSQIAGILADPACRLLTLTGLGGIGKTRLALEAAEEQLNCFAQGVFYVPLAALNLAEMLVQEIARALRFRPQEKEEPQAQLFRFLREKEVLLVLDNFDHLLDEAIFISSLLSAAPHLKILTTSREPLAIQEEWLLRTEGLRFPDSESDKALEPIETYEAVQLFVQSARRMQPKFSLHSALPSVVRICKLLEGLPLGIELAAGNLYTARCEDIAEQIEHNMDILTTSLRNIPERHRSLRATFEYSWQLLTASEQQILAGLCEFRGGFTLESADEVVGASLKTLLPLVEKSLIEIDPAERYDLHEMMRQFAREKLIASGTQEAVQLRHLNYFCKLAETAELRLQRADQLEWINRLDQEQANLRAALDRAIVWQNSPMALRLVSALWRYWSIRMPLLEGRRLVQQALALPGEGGPARAWALYGIGTLARLQGDYPAAHSYYEEANVLFQALNNRQGVANVLAGQGISAGKRSDFSTGESLLEQGLAMFRTLGDEIGTAFTLHNLAALRIDRGGDYETPKRLYEEALRLQEKLGDKQGIANTVYRLGIFAHDMGDYAEARACYQSSLALYTELGDQRMAGNNLQNLGEIANREHDYETSQALLEQCLAIRRELDDRRGRAFTLISLCDIALVHGDIQGSLALLKESLSIFYEMREKRNIVYVLLGLAEVNRKGGNPIHAARYLGAAHGLCKAINLILPAVDQRDQEHEISAIREALDEAAFQQEYGLGFNLTLDEVVAFSLA